MTSPFARQGTFAEGLTRFLEQHRALLHLYLGNASLMILFIDAMGIPAIMAAVRDRIRYPAAVLRLSLRLRQPNTAHRERCWGLNSECSLVRATLGAVWHDHPSTYAES